MAPKARTQRSRDVGLLGLAHGYQSSDDSDWSPGDEGPGQQQQQQQQQGVEVVDMTLDESEPQEDEVPLAKRLAARVLKAAPSRQQARPAAGPSAAGPSSAPLQVNRMRMTGPVRSLPPDVWTEIFRRACKHQALRTAAAIPMVCKLWRDLARGLPELWSHLDLTPKPRTWLLGDNKPVKVTDAVVKRLTSNCTWQEVTYVKFTDHKQLTDASLVYLAEGCPRLGTLDLTGCTNLRQEGVEKAIQRLMCLTSLNLSSCLIQPRGTGLDRVIKAALTPRPGQVTCSLQKLVAISCPSLSRASMQALQASTKVAGNKSSGSASTGVPYLLELKHIDLSDSGKTEGRLQLVPERLQAVAPNLEVLRITGLGGVFGWEESSFKGTGPPGGAAAATAADAAAGEAGEAGASAPKGWKALKVLEVGAAELFSALGQRVCFNPITNGLLLRLAQHSPQLHTLDLSGCTQHTLNSKVFGQLTCQGSLKVLRLRRCCLGSNQGLIEAGKLFGSSLELVDVSGCGGTVGDEGVVSMAMASPHLTALDLSGSAVTAEGLVALLDHCPKLTSLDVSSCRSLPRLARTAAQSTNLDRAALLKSLRQG